MKIVAISIVSALLFDLPLQEISKIITKRRGNDTEITTCDESSPIEVSESVIDTNINENVVDADNEIDEIWNNESSTKVSFADVVDEEDIYSKRSFTPVWKKSDDEKPVWGDEDEEDTE